MTLGVAVIGCGDMGTQHARAWQARGDAEVVAVYDPLEDRRERAADMTGAKSCRSVEEAILHDRVAVVSVCTPICFHSQIACFAAGNGRHVLSEKAIALSVQDAEAMIAAARDNHVLLAVSHQYRSFGRNRRYRELLAGGAFGGPVFARYTDIREVRPKRAMHRRSMNGGPIIDMTGHFYDTMRFITGEEPVSVHASGHIFGRGKERLAGIDDPAIDAAAIEVRMGDGHVLNVLVNWGMPEGFPVSGEEFFIGPQMSARTVKGGIECRFADRVEHWEPDQPDQPGPAARIADLASAITSGSPLEVSGEDGLKALRVSLAALQSIQSHQTVFL